jgi:phospholipase C
MRQAAIGAGGLALGGGSAAYAMRQAPALPLPAQSGIDHVIVLMMENRSFDHYLGWVPGADGRQAGLTYLDSSGTPHPTHHLAPDFQGCGHPDPDHSYEGGRIEYNGGACDGWLRAGANDDYAIGYYTDADLAFFAQAYKDWTVPDRYFSGTMGPTYPNRFYMHAAQTDRLVNSTTISTLPTIWDLLAAAGLTGRYYFGDVPFLALWGPKYIPISRPFTAFLSDCAAGTLPHVSYVDPRFLGASLGVSEDDHPHADIRNGQAFINRVYSAVISSPAFRRTLLVINYDEWGGFFDHVPPPILPIPTADADAGATDGLLGFRVPSLIVSPYAPKKTVTHATIDHTSILKFIEWRWGLPPLSVRDSTATNLAEVLDFKNPKPRRPEYDVPSLAIPTPCDIGVPDKWLTLLGIAQGFGWF